MSTEGQGKTQAGGTVEPIPSHLSIARAALEFMNRVNLSAQEVGALQAVQSVLSHVAGGSVVLIPVSELTEEQRARYEAGAAQEMKKTREQQDPANEE
jgi:hypothetical protein